MESGNLAHKGVLSLLTELSQNRATGSLKLERAPLQKAVYFRDGQILFAASNDPKDQLASILVEEGKLGPDQMQIAQARVSAGNPLAKVLTELGYISQRELADAARLKVEKILTDLFGWKEGSYQFAEKSLPKGAIDLELSTPGLMFNGIRRMQDREWVLGQLGSLDTVLSPTEAREGFLQEAKPDDQARDVLRMVDGVKNVKQIGVLSSLSEFEVCKILSAALLLGLVRKGTGEAASVPAASPTPTQEGIFSLPADDALDEGTELPLAEPETFEHTIRDTEARSTGHTERVSTRPPQRFEPPPPAPSVTIPPVSRPPFKVSQASSLFIDETESQGAGQEFGRARVPPRPRRMGRVSRGWTSNKMLTAAVGILLLVGGGAAGYFYVWPMIAPDRAGSRTPPDPSATPKRTTPAERPGQTPPMAPSPQQAPTGPSAAVRPKSSSPDAQPTTATEPPAVDSPPATGKATRQPTSSVAGKPPSAAPAGPETPASTSTSPTQPAPSPRSAQTTPPPPTKAPSPRASPTTSSASLAQGQELLRNGKISEAGAVFQQVLENTGTEKFTIAVGVYCDMSNVRRAYQNSGNSERLIVLPHTVQGRSCFRVFWGLFDSQESAGQSVPSLPPAIRSPDSTPVPISRLIR